MQRLALLMMLGLGACTSSYATRDEPTLRAATNPAEMRALRADLIETYVRAGSLDVAVPLLREALHDEPKSARLRTLLGTVLLERGQAGQAAEEARGALALDSGYAPAYGLLGRVEQRRGKPEAAIEAHRRATDLAPSCVRCWNNLGYSLFLAGRDREAITSYERALRLDPNARIVYNNLGFAYGRSGDEDAARKAFLQAVPAAEAEQNLAICRELRQRGSAAVPISQKEELR